MFKLSAVLSLLLLVLASCGGDGSTSGGDFELIQFLESGLGGITRNKALEFQFSQPVDPEQHFTERLAIRNTTVGPAGSDFTNAMGAYIVSGELVTFMPQLPTLADRSDAGFRPDGEYHVYLKGGPDALRSATGDSITNPQEFVFETGEFFSDVDPTNPPRGVVLWAIDSTNGSTVDLSRSSPDPNVQAMLDSAELIAGGKIIEPGAGPDYLSPWYFELTVTEPLDPASVNTANISLREIRADALDGSDSADPGTIGTPVNHNVPIRAELRQLCDDCGQIQVQIRVTPLSTLVDDTRYRLTLRGEILGIDFRKAFIGENGLTGDGESTVDGVPYTEVGGLGYVTEFLVCDRAAIEGSRTVLYSPLTDGIYPEAGQTSLDPEEPEYPNTSVYDPPEQPGNAIGIVPAFGDGSDGDLAVAGGSTLTLDTGDTPNDAMGNPFAVMDVDPDDRYANTSGSMPEAATRTWDSNQPSEWNFVNLTVSSSATLRVTGVNPARFRVQSIVSVHGLLDASGENGANGTSGAGNKVGGSGGPGGFAGGDVKAGLRTCNISGLAPASFDNYLNGCAAAKAASPYTEHGEGPGRGHAGGETYTYDYYDCSKSGTNKVSGTGGGGGGHAFKGEDGGDVRNVSGAIGTPGVAYDDAYGHQNSGLIGVRGVGGSPYGDSDMLEVLVGGSGGGGGGTCHTVSYSTTSGSGGSGGGGGGMLEIYCRGDLYVSGVISVSGGDGGKGAIFAMYSPVPTSYMPTGPGGGGSGGGLVLISGGNINAAGGVLDASGGAGGPPANQGTSIACSACNEGGDGSVGYILAMDLDGTIEGLLPGEPGEYVTPTGVLTVSRFETRRFGLTQAVTELFHVGTAAPEYADILAADVSVMVHNDKQRIELFASSAVGSASDPLKPDPATETDPALIATIEYAGGGVRVTPEPGGMSALNPPGDDARRPFVRVLGFFEYGNDIEAAAGPYAYLDSVTLRFSFNG